MSGEILLGLRFILLVGLYAFLGGALWTLWRELRQQTQAVSNLRVPVLILDSGDDAHPSRFIKPEVLIGRDPSCDYTLDNQTVSTQHARLSFHHSQWWLEDLVSTNGTFLNGERVLSPLVVTTGDEMQCGMVGLKIFIGEFEES